MVDEALSVFLFFFSLSHLRFDLRSVLSVLLALLLHVIHTDNFEAGVQISVACNLRMFEVGVHKCMVYSL